MTPRRFLATTESGWKLLVRLMIGLIVFFPEGLQKLLFPGILGAGRFAWIGIPSPDILAPLVGVTEILCGALIIIDLATRLAAMPLGEKGYDEMGERFEELEHKMFGRDGFEVARERITKIEAAFGLGDLAGLTAPAPPAA